MKPIMSEPITYSNCGVCRKIIKDRYYVAMGSKKLHNECICCTQCSTSLSNETSCCEKDGIIYCKRCYYSIFPVTLCVSCRKGIPKNNLAMQAKDMFYHVECFCCVRCHKKLETGQKYGLQGQDLYCEVHHRSNIARAARSVTKTEPGHTDLYSSPTFDKNYREIKQEFQIFRKQSPSTVHVEEVLAKVQAVVAIENNMQARNKIDIQESMAIENCYTKNSSIESVNRMDLDFSMLDETSSPGARSSSDADILPQIMSSGGSSSDEERGGSRSKTNGNKETKRRSRTRFQQFQLLAMKDLFDIDKNPDSTALSTLSEKIGLKKRVLQVWFQNSRAKSRKGQSIFSGSIERLLNQSDE